MRGSPATRNIPIGLPRTAINLSDFVLVPGGRGEIAALSNALNDAVSYLARRRGQR